MNEESSFKDLENLSAHRVSKLYYMVDSANFINLIVPFVVGMTFRGDEHLHR